MKNYQECYELYCETKRDIDEEPLNYRDWLLLEKEAEEEMKSLKGKKVKFWFWEGIEEKTKYHSTGIVTWDNPKTDDDLIGVQDDADGVECILCKDQVELI